MFGFSDTWQLAINTGTTVVTFLMVFVIQASQNREARATQLKLDELIRAMKGARNELIDVEEASDETVELHEGALPSRCSTRREVARPGRHRTTSACAGKRPARGRGPARRPERPRRMP